METGVVVKCSECEETDVIIKKARKSYCRNCWRYRCEFQFRKRLFELGRPPKGTVGEVFRPAEQVLICYDGSPTSVALINLALHALVFGNREQNEGTTSKIPFPFKFVILVLLESDLNGSPGVEGRQKQHLQSLLRWTNYATKVSNGVPFPLLASCVEMSLKEYQNCEGKGVTLTDTPVVVNLSGLEGQSDSDNQGGKSDQLEQLVYKEIEQLMLPFNNDLDNQLSELRKSLKTKTEDKDLVNILKKNLVNTVAEQLKISRVLLPEDQTSLAVKMFTMMSLGRGCQVADEMSFTSSVNKGILLARPLLDVSDDDLRAYLQTLSDDCTDGIVSKGSSKRKLKIDSVERQCDDFITNLQKGYPATVSTLTRIGSKLESTANQPEVDKLNGELCNQCQFCKRSSDSNVPSLTPEGVLCYGCQNFINNSKGNHFANLLHLGNTQSCSTSKS